MRPTRRETVLVVAPAAFVAATLLWFQSGESTDERSTAGAGHGSAHGPAPFMTSGDINGEITPGAVVPLDLSFENLNDFDLIIEGIIVTVQDVDAPRADPDHPCSVADFVVRRVPANASLRLDGNRTQDLSGLGLARDRWPAVGMVNRLVNQDGCKHAVLRLGYEATGVGVHR